jgi:hypothetical protein
MCPDHKKTSMKKKVVLISISFLVLILAGCSQEGKYKEFAECLAEKGITMYGERTCPHCAEQKYLFGDDFKYVAYVECADVPELCAKVELYPTWINSQGERKEGVQRLDDLATWSGCTLP